MTQNKKQKWDGRSRITTSLYRQRFNEIFKKKEEKNKQGKSDTPPDPDNHEYE